MITTSADEAIEATRRHSQTKGMFCGNSLGCDVTAAGKLSKRQPEIGRIVVMINDARQRYFSAPPGEGAKYVEVPKSELRLDPHSASEPDKHQSRFESIE